MIDRRMVVAGAVSAATFIALGSKVYAAKPQIYSNSSSNIAINGYDPVAYFTQKMPVEGSSEHSTKWNGAIWHFSSKENKAAFLASPQKYAPQYGGYCAFAVSYGSTATTVPEAWSIVGGKLYLNNSLSVRKRWNKDPKKFIKRANANWPGVLK